MQFHTANGSNFYDSLFAFLKLKESISLPPYDDAGNIAIGMGFNLRKGGQALRDAVMLQLGLTVGSRLDSTNPAEAIEAGYIKQLNDAMLGSYSQVDVLHQVMSARALGAANDPAFAAYIGTSSPKDVFEFSTGQEGDAEIQAVFNTIAPAYINTVYSKLGFTPDSQPANFDNSKEKVSLGQSCLQRYKSNHCRIDQCDKTRQSSRGLV